MKVKKLPRWIKECKEILKESDGITRLQGNRHASILLCAPVPTDIELKFNYPWCNTHATKFFEMMENIADVPPEDFLVLPVTLDGRNPVKANTEITLRLFDVVMPHFKKFVCIGSSAFKTFFGYGRLPSITALSGTIVYLKITDHKPLFTFPDVTNLNSSFPPGKLSREDYIAKMRSEEEQKKLETLLVKFKKEFMPL